MKLVSWNVNGVRAIIKKGFLDFVYEEKPDIICLQETKAHPEQVDIALPEYAHHFWHSADKKGYSGTAVFSKIKPLSVSHGLHDSAHHGEGRVITLEFEKYYLVNCYTPNSKRGLLRLDYRQEWDKAFLEYLQELEKKKPVIFCGDLNVAHTEKDLKNPKSNRRNAGFTDEERAGFTRLLEHGFIDTFREFNKEPDNYTWWSYMHNARARNIGWRIDYFGISQSLRKSLKDAFIRPEVMGSDHCPVGIILQ